MLIPSHKLSEGARKVYPDGVDPHLDMEVCDDGITLKAFEDGRVTVDRLLDNVDLDLDWYIPSDFAIEFIIFIQLVIGEKMENLNPKAHYFFIDCIFQQYNVEPFFMARGVDFDELKDRVVILASREFSKSTLVTFLFLYMADKGHVPGFGKVNYGLYVADSMRNNVATTMRTIKKVYLESKYLRGRFEETRLLEESVSFVRKPRTKSEIKNWHQTVEVEGLNENQVPGRMKRTFTLIGLGASTGGRGSRDALARPDFTVFDDMIPSEKDANSNVILEAVESTIEADILPGMNNNGNFSIMIGTPYSKKDPVYRRIEQGTWLPVVFPRGNVLPEDESTFTSVWPDRHTYRNCRRDFVKAQRAKESGDGSILRRILQEHYLRISSEEDRLIPDSNIKWYSRNKILGMLDMYKLFITTDFTTTGGDSSDFSGMATWALSSRGEWYMLDLALRKQTMDMQESELFRQIGIYAGNSRPIEVGIETDGNQTAHIHDMKKAMEIRGQYFQFARQKGDNGTIGKQGIVSRLEGGNKHWRFRMATPFFQNNKIFFPEEIKNTPDMQELMEELKYVTYTGFGTPHDDGCDLISQLVMINAIPPVSIEGVDVNHNDKSIQDIYHPEPELESQGYYGWESDAY